MTPLEIKVLDYAREFMAQAELSPPVRELADAVGASVSSTHRAINGLVRRGLLSREPRVAQGLRLANLPELRGVPTDVLAGELARRGKTLASLNMREPMAVSGQRTCAADTCGHAVQRGHLMCRTHWIGLPMSLRDRIMRSNGARDVRAFERAVTEARDLIDSGEWRRRA
ncbi:helix-turn-helix domain-containing protein [Sphingomonas sp. CROZ-RG-20F-R02-07]|uniref:LexA family protein n=1 Tax=Sphingomonas sp. CROZ-RG-20F-R02-07 TaxID=2914832 RepID=UPI001F59211E|nr:helix-turn-helix domain-containing protein [Sphingomonas sp. CROZ-RG-20F-R02-07]